MDKVNFGMLMVIFMRDNGRMIEHMVLVNIYILMVLNMKDFGLKICNMERVKNFGRIIQNMRVNIVKEKSKDLVHIIGMMEQHIVECG